MLDSSTRSTLASRAKDAVTLHLGKAGPSEALAAQLGSLLETHELVKLRFVDFKDEKMGVAEALAEKTSSELVRILGHTAIFYRRNPDPEKRKILLP
ncbi:MAG TPA: YhbY family RNA-binding protein [Rectinemataceae bacterium]